VYRSLESSSLLRGRWLFLPALSAVKCSSADVMFRMLAVAKRVNYGDSVPYCGFPVIPQEYLGVWVIDGDRRVHGMCR